MGYGDFEKAVGLAESIESKWLGGSFQEFAVQLANSGQFERALVLLIVSGLFPSLFSTLLRVVALAGAVSRSGRNRLVSGFLPLELATVPIAQRLALIAVGLVAVLVGSFVAHSVSQ